jgi:hypothetical protein
LGITNAINLGDPLLAEFLSKMVFDPLPNDKPIQLRDSIRQDSIAKLILPEGINLPPGYDKDGIYLLCTEIEWDRKAEDLSKHLTYIIWAAKEHYKKVGQKIYIFFVIIYGPTVNPSENVQTDFISFIFKPFNIYLSLTNKEELFQKLEEKLKANSPATRLEIFELFILPELYKLDSN